MGKGIYLALSGAVAQSNALDVVANNVANVGTTGFKAGRLRFDQALTRARGTDQTYVQTGAPSPDLSQGAIAQTGNPLDVALSGDGFLAVQTPAGVRYSRAGDLRLDRGGRLVTSGGDPVLGIDGRTLTVPPGTGAIRIAEDGALAADGRTVGQLEIARFAPDALRPEGRTLFVPVAGAQPVATVASGTDAPRITQGALEQSNQNVVRGMIDLVRVSRTYEALHRMIESYREIDDRAARTLGGGAG